MKSSAQSYGEKQSFDRGFECEKGKTAHSPLFVEFLFEIFNQFSLNSTNF